MLECKSAKDNNTKRHDTQRTNKNKEWQLNKEIFLFWNRGPCRACRDAVAFQFFIVALQHNGWTQLGRSLFSWHRWSYTSLARLELAKVVRWIECFGDRWALSSGIVSFNDVFFVDRGLSCHSGISLLVDGVGVIASWVDGESLAFGWSSWAGHGWPKCDKSCNKTNFDLKYLLRP